MVIDGGFSKAYQGKTGIAGYTLVVNSYGMRLVSHEPFESADLAIRNESDIFSDSIIVETALRRQRRRKPEFRQNFVHNIIPVIQPVIGIFLFFMSFFILYKIAFKGSHFLFSEHRV